MHKQERTIYEGETAFESYQVVDMVYEGRPARVLFTNHHRAAQSGIAMDDESTLLFDYNQRFLELALAMQAKRILVIGGGTYTLPMTLIDALPQAHIDTVEIDPGLDTIAKHFFGLTTHKRLSIIHTDGRSFLENTTNLYDLIIIDAFNGTELPYELMTIQAIIALQRRLTLDGIAAMNVIGTYYGRSMKLKSLSAAYQKVFKNVNIYPADDSISLLVSQNFLLIGQKSNSTLDHHIATLPLQLPSSTIENLLFDNPKITPSLIKQKVRQ